MTDLLFLCEPAERCLLPTRNIVMAVPRIARGHGCFLASPRNVNQNTARCLLLFTVRQVPGDLILFDNKTLSMVIYNNVCHTKIQTKEESARKGGPLSIKIR
jgi:hypothetical protein